jgi:hypothetical protein
VATSLQWTTILGPDPRFGLDVLYACMNQTLGALEDRLQNPPTRAAGSIPGIEGKHLSAVFKWILTVLGGLIVGGIAYWG